MPDLGRLLIVAGMMLLTVGLLVSLLGSHLPLGRLPGDLRFSVGNTRLFVPIATSILLSLILTVVANIVLRFIGR